MKIVIDTDIPYIKGVFEPYFGKVIYKKGIEIVHNDIKDAVALIVRTRTICNEALLKGSGIRAIATATVGTDHIDIDYCNTQGIEVFSAPGSNAGGVLQWMIAVLFELSQGTGLQGKVLGVIGVGRIGGLLVKAAEALGLTVLQCDPPRARIEGDKHFFPLKVLLKECDLFSFHVPLSFKGVDATYQMAGNDFFKLIKPGAWIINSARGGVVDEQAMMKGYLTKNVRYALDVWDNEPHIDRQVLSKALFATPHIAGYTIEGKVNATIMAVKAIASFFSLNLRLWKPEPYPIQNPFRLDMNDFIENGAINYRSLFRKVYSISDDDMQLRNNPDHFESIRSNYRLRHDNSGYSFDTDLSQNQKEIIRALGFNLITDDP